MYCRVLFGMVSAIHLAKASVCSTVMGVSTRRADLGPWIRVQLMGDQTDLANSVWPVLALTGGETKTSTWSWELML